MLLSKSSENAIRLVFHLMKNENKHFCRIKVIARELGLPYFQLAKIAQSLIQNGILISRTGPRGGVALNSDPEKLHLIDIVSPFEPENFLDQCILGLGVCGSHNPCPIHYYWKETKKKITEMFNEKTLQDLKHQDLLGEINKITP